MIKSSLRKGKHVTQLINRKSRFHTPAYSVVKYTKKYFLTGGWGVAISTVESGKLNGVSDVTKGHSALQISELPEQVISNF